MCDNNEKRAGFDRLERRVVPQNIAFGMHDYIFSLRARRGIISMGALCKMLYVER